MNKSSDPRHHGTAVSGRRSAATGILLTCALCLLCGGAVSTDPALNPLDQARTSLEKWIETQRIISQEKRDFVVAREMLNARIELIEREIASLKGRIQEAEEGIADADKKRAELLAENDAFKKVSDGLVVTVASLEGRVKRLLARLPEPIRERVKPLSQRLPDNPEQTRLTAAERFQNVVGILNEIGKFNREITPTSEVRTLPDGTSVEVAALYLGISQGYYAGTGGQVAGVGMASDTGWVWTPMNEAAPHILRVIAILKNEEVAAYVPLPVKIE